MLILCLLASVSYAQASIAYPMYVSIDEFWVNLSINGSGIAECEAYLSTSISGCTPSLTVTLKKSSNGLSWTSVKSWTASGSYLVGASIDETTAVAAGISTSCFLPVGSPIQKHGDRNCI